MHLRPCLPLSEKSPKPDPVALGFLLALPECQQDSQWAARLLDRRAGRVGLENLLTLEGPSRVRPFGLFGSVEVR